jgi:hypothetical protein
VVADNPVGNAEQPAAGPVSMGDITQPSPRHGEHLGRRILTIGRPEASYAVADDVGVMRCEDLVEPLIGWRAPCRGSRSSVTA